MSKRYNHPIRVFGKEGHLEAFIWRQRLYRIEKTLESWTANHGWWQKHPKKRHFSVVSATTHGGIGVFELYYEHLKKQWFLLKVLD